MIMQALEILGTVAIIGLLFTAENRNKGVSQAIIAGGAFHSSVVKGIGPY